MDTKVLDYLREYRREHGRIPVSPIWGGDKAFPFLCLDHRTIAGMLGFEVVHLTSVLDGVREGQLDEAEQIEKFIQSGRGTWDSDDYDADSVIRSELVYLDEMKRNSSGNWIGGGCFGPLTVLSGIVGIGNLLRKIVREPQQVLEMLGIVNCLLIRLAEEEAAAGMDFFWVAEPLASVISPRSYYEFSGRWIREIFDAAGVPGFLHVCGKTTKHTPELIRSGASVLSIDSVTDIGECIRELPEQIAVMGNISPDILRNGSRSEVSQEVDDVLEAVRGYDNFILSTGCSIIEGTPAENMEVLFEKSILTPASC